MKGHSDDIIVIGAGGCGLMAALVAARVGVRVLLLEKTDKPGGGTAYSANGMHAAGTRFQRALGIEDSPEQYARDISLRNAGESDLALTQALAESSARIVHFLADIVGIEFHVGDFPFGHSVRRSHRWTADKSITDFLFQAVQRDQNIQVRFSSSVLSLRQDADASVTGVITDDGVLAAGRVILATGGFGASQELLSEYIRRAVGIPFPGHYGSAGDGIRMGLAFGAAVESMGSFQPYPAYIGPEQQSVSPKVAIAGGIMVDARGKRFVDETRYPGGLGTGMLDLPDKQAYEIFDERVYRLHRNLLEEFLSSGLLKRAETPEELAGKLGIDAGALDRTILGYDSAAGGGPDRFGRVLPVPFKAPVYGIKVKVALFHTQGSLKLNVHGQVLRPDGSIITSLYAGGGVAAGVSGTGVEGYLPGNGLLASLGLGMLAAEHARQELNLSASQTGS